MSRYKIFQNNLINYNAIAQYNYNSIKKLPNITSITINFKGKQLIKNQLPALQCIYLTEYFTNKVNYAVKRKNLKDKKKSITGYGAQINEKSLYGFVEFLVIFILPLQIQIPKITFRQTKKFEVIVTFDILNWTDMVITGGVEQLKPAKIIIKTQTKSIEEAKTLLSYLNFPCSKLY
jgi:ribosomal protein L5